MAHLCTAPASWSISWTLTFTSGNHQHWSLFTNVCSIVIYHHAEYTGVHQQHIIVNAAQAPPNRLQIHRVYSSFWAEWNTVYIWDGDAIDGDPNICKIFNPNMMCMNHSELKTCFPQIDYVCSMYPSCYGINLNHYPYSVESQLDSKWHRYNFRFW